MNASKKVVIAGYVRSPFTPAGKGELKSVRADDLAAQTIQGLIRQTGVNPALIEDLKLGCSFPEGEQGLNVARQVIFLAGLPQSIPAATINRFCGSSMQAIHDAAGMIAAGMAEAVVAAGVESMSRVPMGGFNPSPNLKLYNEFPAAYISMGETAENVADRFNVSRQDQEKFSLSSQFKTAAAKAAGKFDGEIVPIVKADGSVVTEDGCPRPNSTAEALAKLPPAFKQGGSVTAGTSSPVTDGASAVLVCSAEFAEKHGLTILAEIESFAVTGCDPATMGMGPVSATNKALAKAGLNIKDMDVVELNEAFASQSIACVRELGLDAEKVNQNGGALALGHPLGASGARITGEAAKILHDTGKDYALATMCIGGGQGIATILKKPAPKSIYPEGKNCWVPKKMMNP